MRDDSRDLARVWMRYVDDDLRAARLIGAEVPTLSAYHVQQAVEKALKAVIVMQGQEPEFTHDLKRVYASAAPLLEWSADETWLAQVSSWVATTRYPADVYGPPPQAAEASDALVRAEELADEIRRKLA
jgi:HEPN domain-containing protein